MKKIFFLLALVFTGTASAGEYIQGGYITEVKVNYQGSECDIGLSYNMTGAPSQKGRWSCNSSIGDSMLGTAKMASALGLKVYVTFEGEEKEYKQVHSINVINHKEE